MSDHGEYPVLHAERILVGHCPDPRCGRALAVLNDHESWPLVICPCGESFPTTSLVNRVRLDRGWLVSVDDVERELRP